MKHLTLPVNLQNADSPALISSFIPGNLPTLIHPDKYAEQIGLSVGVIGGWIDAGYIPTVKIGRYRLINLTKLTLNLADGGVL